jgi:hypothetical protein
LTDRQLIEGLTARFSQNLEKNKVYEYVLQNIHEGVRPEEV